MRRLCLDDYIGEASELQMDLLDDKFVSGEYYIKEVGRCPYCGSEVEIEPTQMCCGEVHGEMVTEVWAVAK